MISENYFISKYKEKSIEVRCIVIFIVAAMVAVVANLMSIVNLFLSNNDLSWSVESIGGLWHIFLWGPLMETVLMAILIELFRLLNKKIYIYLVIFMCFIVSFAHAAQAKSLFDKFVYFLAVFFLFLGYSEIYVILRDKYKIYFVGVVSFLVHSLCNIFAVFVWFAFMICIDR